MQSRLTLQCRWFEAMEQKPSYLGTKSDFFTHVHDLPPQLGGNCFTFVSLLARLLACLPAGLLAMLYVSPNCLVHISWCVLCSTFRCGTWCQETVSDRGLGVKIFLKTTCCMAIVPHEKLGLQHACAFANCIACSHRRNVMMWPMLHPAATSSSHCNGIFDFQITS